MTAVKETVPAASAELGALIDKLEANRKARRPIEAKLKPLEEEASGLKADIIRLLDEAHTLKSGTKKATVSISEITRPVFDDADKAVKFLKREGWLHILDFKVTAWRELIEKKGADVPGTHSEVVRRQLNHSSLK